MDEQDELPEDADLDLGDADLDLGALGDEFGDDAVPVNVEAEEVEKGVTRFQMIEYLNQREWRSPQFERRAS